MTYSTSLDTDLDVVRFLTGDTSNDSSTEYLQDGEITYLLTQETNVTRAASSAAEAIASKFATRAQSVSVGDTSIDYGDLADRYAKLAIRLRSQATRRGGAPVFAGGISIADRDSREANTDRVQPFFTRYRPGDDRTVDPLTQEYVR